MRQLVLLTVMLALVVVLMNGVRDPGRWTWLTGLDADRLPAGERLDRVATRVSDGGEELLPGTFVAGAPPQARLPADDEPKKDPATRTELDALGVDSSVFDGVKDRTRVVPNGAYFHLLDVARRTPGDELDRVARRDRTFAHFARAPELHRGEPVYLKGWLQRLTEITPPRNRDGFDRLYEGWLFTEESQGNPYVIVVSELPRGMPLGAEVRESVTFTGLFLKLWNYQSGDGVRFAPLIVGRTLTWHSAQTGPTVSGFAYAASLALVVVLLAALYFAIWWSQRTAVMLREKRATPTSPDDKSIAAVGEMPAMNTENYLAQVEREAKLNSSENSNGAG